jgi:hypothetical protein
LTHRHRARFHRAFSADQHHWPGAGRWNRDPRRAGLSQVGGRAHRSYQPGGHAWLVARLGIERLRGQIHQQGASQADLDEALAALDDHTRTIIGAPIVTAWGQRTT